MLKFPYTPQCSSTLMEDVSADNRLQMSQFENNIGSREGSKHFHIFVYMSQNIFS